MKFYSRGKDYGLFLTPTEAVLALSKVSIKKPDKGAGIKEENITTESAFQHSKQTSVLRMKLKGANPQPEVKGIDELSGKANYFAGTSPDKWHTDIATYAKVRYEEVYPGIDLIYYGNQSQLEYDFVVAPGADPRLVSLNFEGAEQVKITKAGELLLRTRTLNRPGSKPSTGVRYGPTATLPSPNVGFSRSMNTLGSIPRSAAALA